LAVVDLGGGTLDISILDVGDGVYDIQNISGDVKLGGSDMDAELLQYVISDIRRTHNIAITEKDHPVEVSRLRDGCENMKINLSSLDTYTMELTHFLNKPRYTFVLTRKELERIAKPFFQRIKETIEKALREYGGTIDHFLLVGNATRMPAVIEIVKSVIRAKHLRDINPGSIVASGAALQGAILLGDLKKELLLDVVPYSLGISVLKKDSKIGEEEMSRLIERNTTIPTVKSQEYTTTKDNQTVVNIRIYQGESSEPGKNYFLGDFHLEGIVPAPAGTPKIGVEFGIGIDCILTVTAIDKGTNKQQSIRIEGAVTLSPSEKEGLRRFFAESESIYPLEKKIAAIETDIDRLCDSFEKSVQAVEQGIKDFTELFHEKVEMNARFYKATTEQTRIIQNMFSQKDQLSYALQRYKDEASSTRKNLQQILSKHLDFSDKEVVRKLQERFNILSQFKDALVRTTDSLEKETLHVIIEWIQILKAMDPDIDKMSSVKVANYHFVTGRFAKAKEIIESMAAGPDGLTEEAFQLLLRCIVRMCLREEYRETHKKYGSVFRLVYPDFNKLDSFLKKVDHSVYMIQVQSQRGSLVGSGFSIASNLIATNRHVVEGATAQNIRVVGKSKTLTVTGVEVDPINDLAILKVDEPLIPFRLGEFNFVAPGEQVLALGFPSPSSNIHSENIYISRGIVNSIRNIDVSPERVIFIDAKIGRGMSGGPLINDLGEVIGIVTRIQYEVEQSDKGTFAIGDQPVALPIHLVRNYLLKHAVAADSGYPKADHY
jgi:molecular chaperone DnaK